MVDVLLAELSRAASVDEKLPNGLLRGVDNKFRAVATKAPLNCGPDHIAVAIDQMHRKNGLGCYRTLAAVRRE